MRQAGRDSVGIECRRFLSAPVVRSGVKAFQLLRHSSQSPMLTSIHVIIFLAFIIHLCEPLNSFNIHFGLCEDADGRAQSVGVVEPEAQVQGRDLVQLGLGKVEGGALEVLLQSLDAVGLGDDDNLSLRAPTEDDLAGGLAVLGGQAGDGLRLEEGLGVLGPGVVQLEEGLGAEGGVTGDGDVVLLGHLDELGLGEVGVVLDLEDGAGDLGVGHQVVEELGVEVGDADGADEAAGVLGGLDHVLHGLPGLGDGDLGQGGDLGLLLVGPEAGEAQLVKGDELLGDGEVHQEEVDVAEAPGLVLELGHLEGVLALVVVVPQLGGDEELLTLDQAVGDGLADSLAGLGAVGVVPGSIELAVAELDGVVDGVGAGLAGDLPDAEADNRHVLEHRVSGGGRRQLAARGGGDLHSQRRASQREPTCWAELFSGDLVSGEIGAEREGEEDGSRVSARDLVFIRRPAPPGVLVSRASDR